MHFEITLYPAYQHKPVPSIDYIPNTWDKKFRDPHHQIPGMNLLVEACQTSHSFPKVLRSISSSSCILVFKRKEDSTTKLTVVQSPHPSTLAKDPDEKKHAGVASHRMNRLTTPVARKICPL